jgi:DNA-directed RNA polymerase II subunit RPB9
VLLIQSVFLFAAFDSRMVSPVRGVITKVFAFDLFCLFVPTNKENKRSKSLQYACRLCRYTEPAPDQPLVYRNEKKKEVGNILHTVPSAIYDDPTLARSTKANCSKCHHNEAVFFQSDVAQSDSLALIFVCCNCGNKWVN